MFPSILCGPKNGLDTELIPELQKGRGSPGKNWDGRQGEENGCDRETSREIALGRRGPRLPPTAQASKT